MSIAYIDSSCVVAVAFGEPGAKKVTGARSQMRLVSSALLDAEVRSALARERASNRPAILGEISWVHPNRGLSAEIDRVLIHGALRGADLWHVACALFLDPTATELTFLTLDVPQRRVASALGFRTP